MRNGLRREPGPRTYHLLVDEAKILNEIFSHVQTVSTKPFFHLRNGLGTRLTVVLKGSVCILIDSSIIIMYVQLTLALYLMRSMRAS